MPSSLSSPLLPGPRHTFIVARGSDCCTLCFAVCLALGEVPPGFWLHTRRRKTRRCRHFEYASTLPVFKQLLLAAPPHRNSSSMSERWWQGCLREVRSCCAGDWGTGSWLQDKVSNGASTSGGHARLLPPETS